MTQNPGSIPRQRMEQKSRCWTVAGHPGETRLRDARKGNNRCLSHKGIIIPRVYVISVFLTSLFHSSKGKKQEQSLGFGAPLLFRKVSIRFLLLEENFYNILQESKEKLRLFRVPKVSYCPVSLLTNTFKIY